MIYIFWTCANDNEAKQIIHALLEKRVIACASLLPNVTSIYRWKEKIEESTEIKVILKTQVHHFDSICHYIKTNGSYEVPEIAQLAIDKADADYLAWLKLMTSKNLFT